MGQKPFNFQKHISTVDETRLCFGFTGEYWRPRLWFEVLLLMTSITGNAGNTDEKTDGKVDDDADEKNDRLTFLWSSHHLARYTFQIRSLSYVRFGFSLGCQQRPKPGCYHVVATTQGARCCGPNGHGLTR